MLKTEQVSKINNFYNFERENISPFLLINLKNIKQWHKEL